jgi:tetratricopeptide (TPR) repeat protein
MKNVFRALLFIFFYSSAYPQTAEDLFKKGIEQETQKKYSGAISLYDEVIKATPDHSDAYLHRANCYMSTKKFDFALKDYNSSIRSNPENSKAYLQRALFYNFAQNYYAALNDCEMAVKYASTDSIKYAGICSRGSTKLMMRNFKAAYDDFQLVLARDSNNVNSLNDMGMALSELGKNQEALQCFYKLVRLDSLNAMTYGNIGFYLQKEKKYEESISYLNKGIKLSKDDNAYMYNNRGYAKLMLNDLDGAMKDINKSIKLYPGNSYAYKNRALVYLQKSDKLKACEDLSKALKLKYTERYGNEVEDLVDKNCK